MDKPLHGKLSKYFWKMWEEDRERERGERRLKNENGLSARVVLCRARVFVCCPCAFVSAHSLGKKMANQTSLMNFLISLSSLL